MDYNLILMLVEKGIRGRVSQWIIKYAEVNNKYMEKIHI